MDMIFIFVGVGGCDIYLGSMGGRDIFWVGVGRSDIFLGGCVCV